METKFQTSFIPKKPLVSAGTIGGIATSAPRKKGTSIFMTLAGLLFLISLGVAGGMYYWKSFLLSSQESYKTQLAQREKQFNGDLIEELKRQDVKITLASQLIRNHLAMSNIFTILGSFTIESVRFLSLDLVAPANSTEDIKVTMKGYGSSFSAVAFQSDVLGKLVDYGLRGIVKNPILSDPSLDVNNSVSFGFTATIDPSTLSYEKSLGIPETP